MKYRYLVGLVVALSFNNGFAADIEYAKAYRAITADDGTNAATRINTALAGRADFDTNLDSNAATRIITGHELRQLVIGLGIGDLQTVVEANHEFFKRSFGMHLLLCNVLNMFAQPDLPCYIMEEFSFRTYFERLADKIADDQTKIFFKSRFTLGLLAIDANMDSRFEFQARNNSIPYAIRKFGVQGDLPIDGIIGSCYLDDAAIEQEKHDLRMAPGRAVHLIDETAFDESQLNWEANDFVGLQKYTIQNPVLCKDIPAIDLEIFQSLSDNTPGDYHFREQKLVAHMKTIRAAMSKAKNPTQKKKTKRRK